MRAPVASLKMQGDLTMRISQVIFTVERTLRELVEALANRLTFGDNMECSIKDVEDSGAADTDFIVDHNLGRLPKWYLANASAGFVYDGDTTQWTTQQIVLKCSAANSRIKLVVF